MTLPLWEIVAFLVVEGEESGRFLTGAAIAAAAALATVYVLLQPGRREWRLIEEWAAGQRTDRLEVLESTYAFARDAITRGVVIFALSMGIMSLVVGAVVEANTSRLIQHGIVGTALGIALQLIAVHPFVEAFLRPVRVGLADDTGIGAVLPRSQPSFATWASVSVVATAWTFALAGASLAVARIEQLTKTTSDTILLTQHTLDALAQPPAGLIDRGSHQVKGKAGTVRVHALEPAGQS